MTTATSLEKLARALAPSDLTARPIYIVLTSDSPPDELTLRDSLGSFHPTYDENFKNWLQSQGRWAGRGPCIVLNDEAINAIWPSDAEDMVNDICIHELAHVLTNPNNFDELSLAESAAIELAAIYSIGRANAAFDRNVKSEASWRGHGAEFVRVVCHLIDRCRQFGIWSQPTAVFDLTQFGFRPTDEYFRAVSGEFGSFRNAPLRDLIDHTPPTAFTDLWRADVRRQRSKLLCPDLDLFS